MVQRDDGAGTTTWKVRTRGDDGAQLPTYARVRAAFEAYQDQQHDAQEARYKQQAERRAAGEEGALSSNGAAFYPSKMNSVRKQKQVDKREMQHKSRTDALQRLLGDASAQSVAQHYLEWHGDAAANAAASAAGEVGEISEVPEVSARALGTFPDVCVRDVDAARIDALLCALRAPTPGATIVALGRVAATPGRAPGAPLEWGGAARRLLLDEAASRRRVHANEALALELLCRLLAARARPRGVELLAGESALGDDADFLCSVAGCVLACDVTRVIKLDVGHSGRRQHPDTEDAHDGPRSYVAMDRAEIEKLVQKKLGKLARAVAERQGRGWRAALFVWVSTAEAAGLVAEICSEKAPDALILTVHADETLLELVMSSLGR